ncbi:MAG: PQQ-dependent sugar dehydrogenase [Myxococcota bacterium]
MMLTWMWILGCASEPQPPCVGGVSPDAQGLAVLEQGVALTLNQAPYNLPQEMAMPDGDDRFWYVALHKGKIVRFENLPSAQRFDEVIDLSDRVYGGHDQLGLMSLVFHPDFISNGQMFVFYNPRPSLTGTSNTTARVSRFTSYDGGYSFDVASEEILLDIPRSELGMIHNGGHMAFGPDGFLWISLGDNGGVADPAGFAQDPKELWGSMLRIDVDGGVPYAIPPDNPYANGGDGDPAVWAYGFRNPWQWDIDPISGEVWLGDVGMHHIEEVNYVEKGQNYGWATLEGDRCVATDCDPSGTVGPAYLYTHNGSNASVIGGRVYRGSALPQLYGFYLFTDYFGAWLKGIRRNPAQPGGFEILDVSENLGVRISSFAEGPDGEIWGIQRGSGAFYVLRPPKAAGRAPRVPSPLLSETGCVNPDAPWQPAKRMTPYALNVELWSDGSDKERYFHLPEDAQVAIDAEGDLQFPPGAVLMKTFRLDERLVETRLLVHHTDGRWGGYSYQWDEDGQDATLLASSADVTIGALDWHYPSRNECMHCHTDQTGVTIGPELLQLNRDVLTEDSGASVSQLDALADAGLFADEIPPFFADNALAPLSDTGRTLEERATSYLHANCASCHRADAQSPELRYLEGVAGYCDQDVLSSVVGGAATLLSPGSPEASALYQRMGLRGENQMPPLASVRVHTEGAEVVAAWIAAMTDCP